MKYYGIFITAVMIFFLACSGSGSDKDKFINTYKEILIVWGKYPDSAQAVPRVRDIIKKNGYNEKTFRDAYFGFARNPQEFMAMLDTARARADQEINKEKQKYRRE
jgi:hypothetical protein